MGLQPPCAMAIGYETKNVPAISQGSNILSILDPYPSTESHSAAGSVARTDDYDEAHAHPFGTGSPSANTTTSVLRFLLDRMQALRNRDFTRAFQHSVAETGRFTLGTGVQQQSPDNACNINSFISDTSQLSLNVPGHDDPSTSAAGPKPMSRSAAIFNRDDNGESSTVAKVILLEAAMQTEVAIFAIDLKFEESLVRDVIRQTIEENGAFDLTAVVLVKAIQDLQRSHDEPELELEQQQEKERRKLFGGKFPESLPDGEIGYGTSHGTLEFSNALPSDGADSSSVDDPPPLMVLSSRNSNTLK